MVYLTADRHTFSRYNNVVLPALSCSHLSSATWSFHRAVLLPYEAQNQYPYLLLRKEQPAEYRHCAPHRAVYMRSFVWVLCVGLRRQSL
jgi:hypothetical protein